MPDPLKLLFVCSQNIWRSRTAEQIFSGTPGWLVKSAGTEDGARIKITAGLVGWADVVFVMEKKHLDRIRAAFGELLTGRKLVCLQIPDDFPYMHLELIQLLRDRVSEHLPDPGAS
ncbi:MAG: protein tyrosine phosphatase [Opitutaceae bacterium]|nr:protein tyrosine phosphatase [Verrucomicrobiales bacterium]